MAGWRAGRARRGRDGRRRPHRRGGGGRRRRRRPAPSGCAGLTVPGLRQRPQPRLPPRPARAHAVRDRLVLDVARSRCTPSPTGSTPTRYFRLARATYAEMALAGIAVVGEFHYLHHGPGGDALRRHPTRWPTRSIAAAARGRACASRCSTRATSAAASASSSTPTQRRFADGDVDAWAARAGALADGAGRAHRRRRPLRPGRRPGEHRRRRRRGRPSAGAPLHAHVSEQPAENEQTARRLRLHADRAARRPGRARRALHGRPRHPRHARRHRPARRGRLLVLLLPDHRARPRRRHRTGGAPCATPAPGSRSAATPTPSSTCSRRPAPSSSTSAWRPASAARHDAASLLRDGDGGRARQPRLARRRAHRSRARSPT